MADGPADSWLVRNEFLVRRLHSLSGLIPVGAYMVIHLLTNASVINGPGAFQKNVNTIHSLGDVLPLIEWVFIFIPILFHGIFGFVIIGGGLPNTSTYPRASNIRYTMQRVTGILAFLFIMWHVFHMHGWIHADWWIKSVAEPMGGAQFRPYNAASSAGTALQGYVITTLYTIGVLSCVFHLANGIWTMGITWGVWTSPTGQRRASVVCLIGGLALGAVGLSGLFAMQDYGGDQKQEAIDVEKKIYESGIDSGEVNPSPEKRSPEEDSPDSNDSEKPTAEASNEIGPPQEPDRDSP